MSLLPPIGASGIFTLSTPFSSQLIANVSYTCVAIRKLADIINAGFDPYQEYYQPNGINQTTYNTQVNEGVCIVSLESSSGQWLHVPTTYILSYPDSGGIAYTSLVLGISLGPIPNHLSLVQIKQKIVDDVKAYIGVTAPVTTVAVSNTTLVSQETHNSIEAARVAQITNTTTDYAKYLVQKNRADALQLKVAELENYIKTH